MSRTDHQRLVDRRSYKKRMADPEYRDRKLKQAREGAVLARKICQDNMDKMVKLKGDKCEDCGYTYHNDIYDFHHRSPEDKLIAVSTLRRNWEKFKAEADKCALLCSNCHRARHTLERQDGNS